MPNSDVQVALPAAESVAHSGYQEMHLVLTSGSTGVGAELAGHSRWQSFTSPNRLLSAATMLESGNVLLPYGLVDNFRSIAMLVGDLRALGNDGLRIIVREEGESLRLAEVSALIKLGASLVLPGALDAALARQKLLSLEGTRYRGNFRRDVEAVIQRASLAPSHQRIESENFQSFAHSVIDSEGDSRPHTLVVLNPLTAREGLEIDKSLSLGLRDGVYAVNTEGIWILLMACKPLDCQVVLERVLGPSFESLLVGWRKIGRSGDILSAIDKMNCAVNEVEALMA
jgi:Cellulose biosynthesis GIL